MSGCGNLNRTHWFAYYGSPGTSSPVCVRGCGAPNPRYRPEDDPYRNEGSTDADDK